MKTLLAALPRRCGRAANRRRLFPTNVVCVLVVLITGLTSPSSLPSTLPISFPISFPSSHAQEPASSLTQAASAIDKVALHQALLDLTNPWIVMCVAAHPDDEDGTTLTILRRKHGNHTVSLFSTYGEGGQNAVGPELYEELGVIRTRETREAAEIQGSEPHFLGLRDFGFSKSAEETFRMWGHDEALRRMVLKIRELRPDVIITNHDTARGHGHHQATGQLVIEAFDAAADPKRFPEQLTQLSTWQPKRLFVRSRSPAGVASIPERETGKPEKIVAIDPNERDSIRATIYAEQALAALQRHATQGPWPKTIEERLRAQNNTSGKLPLIRYRLAREAANATPLPDRASTLLDGLKLAEASIARLLPPKIDGRELVEFVDQPGRVLDALIDWCRAQQTALARASGVERLRLMERRVNQALAIAAGVTMSLDSGRAVLVPTVRTSFSVNLSNAGDRTVHIRKLSFESWGEETPLEVADLLASDTEAFVTVERVTPKSAQVTVPKSEHLYDGLFSGQSLAAMAEFEVDGAIFSLSTRTNLDVVPAIEIKSISPSPYVWTPQTVGSAWIFQLILANHSNSPFRGVVEIRTVNGLSWIEDTEIQLSPGETLHIQLGPTPAFPAREFAADQVRSKFVIVSILAKSSKEVLTERRVSAVYLNAGVTKGLRVGYLPSFDETLKNSLAALQVNAEQLNLAVIQRDLSSYNTIIIDNRGYQAHPKLIAANAKLLKYVEAGGTLIVFYHKDNEWNPNPDRGRPQLAPYPIILGDERVTEERAPVRLLQPRHPLLNYPNRITSADFKNWLQERGLYYPKEWDPHYKALFASGDEGEVPMRGGLLVARYGRGHYIYTSMVWYRQLAAGVPGAYRMFANLISYGHFQGQKARRAPLKRPAVRSQARSPAWFEHARGKS